MAYFYNFSDQELSSMDAGTFQEYWHAITMIEAQSMLTDMRISDFPSMKNKERGSMHKEIHKKAYPDTYNNSPVISNDDFKKMLTQGR